jgi:hypothetical protein
MNVMEYEFPEKTLNSSAVDSFDECIILGGTMTILKVLSHNLCVSLTNQEKKLKKLKKLKFYFFQK